MYRTSKLQELVIKGIPSSIRGELWLTFSGALHQLRANPGKYAEYVSQSTDNSTIAADEIERDLHRALPEVSIIMILNIAIFSEISDIKRQWESF